MDKVYLVSVGMVMFLEHVQHLISTQLFFLNLNQNHYVERYHSDANLSSNYSFPHLSDIA